MTAATLRLETASRGEPGPFPGIETLRLQLRPVRLSDADAMAETLSDFAVTRMLARVPAPYHRQDALDWLLPRVSGVQPGWCLAITGGGAAIGGLSLAPREGRWHLGYWLNRSHWGRGYMSEAAEAAIDCFFRRMPETAIHSGVFADNPASLRVQEKLGFRITGCRDVYSSARNAMVPHIETLLEPQGLTRRSAA